MSKLKKKGLDKILLNEFKKNKQILGICVGMQIMLKIGEEKKITKGLEILDGKVKELKTKEISAMYSLTVSLCYELKEACDKNDK